MSLQKKPNWWKIAQSGHPDAKPLPLVQTYLVQPKSFWNGLHIKHVYIQHTQHNNT